MPAGIDLVTWAPRKGASGDDRYALDPDGDVRWVGAPTTAYSSIPTLAEVNAGSGINQIIAHISQRQKAIQDAGIAAGGLSFFPPFTEIIPLRRNNQTLAGLRTGVDEIRASEGRSAYVWPTASSRATAQEILDLRKALATDFIVGKQTASNNEWGLYFDLITGAYPPDPPNPNASFLGSPSYQRIGQRCSGTSYSKSRLLSRVLTPAYMGDINAANAVWDGGSTLAVSSTYGCTLEMWKCATTYPNTSFLAARWPDLGTSLASHVFAASVAAAAFEFGSVGVFAAPVTAGDAISFLFCTAQDRGNTNQGGLALWTSEILLNADTPRWFKLYT